MAKKERRAFGRRGNEGGSSVALSVFPVLAEAVRKIRQFSPTRKFLKIKHGNHGQKPCKNKPPLLMAGSCRQFVRNLGLPRPFGSFPMSTKFGKDTASLPGFLSMELHVVAVRVSHLLSCSKTVITSLCAPPQGSSVPTPWLRKISSAVNVGFAGGAEEGS